MRNQVERNSERQSETQKSSSESLNKKPVVQKQVDEDTQLPEDQMEVDSEPGVNNKGVLDAKSGPMADNCTLEGKSQGVQGIQEKVSYWFKNEIEEIMQVKFDSAGGDRVDLSELKDEVGTENPEAFSEILETVFMCILTEKGVPKKYRTSLEYLYMIYLKSWNQKRLVSKKDPHFNQKIDILNRIHELSGSYAFICFQVADMFLDNNVEESIKFLVQNAETSSFLTHIVNQSAEQDSVIELLNIILPTICSRLYGVNISNTEYSKYLSIIETLVGMKCVSSVFSGVDGFWPPNTKDSLSYEHKSLLGPILRLSPLLNEVSDYYFTNDVTSLSNVQLSSIYESLQNEYKVILDRLFFIVDRLIRGSPSTRNDILQWLGNLVNISHLRRGSGADFTKLPSDGLMFNISFILVRLSLPFLDFPTFSKIDKIDMNYVKNSEVLDFSEETRVNASIQEAKEYFDDLGEKTPLNFISDCFFLSLAYLHYGIGGIINRYDRIKSQIKQISNRIESVSSNQASGTANPIMAHLIRTQMPALNKNLNVLKAQKHSIQAVFSFRNFQFDIFDFVIGATTFITRLIDPKHEHPKIKLQIPLYKISSVSELDDLDFLKTKTPKPWKFYPEFILEGIINYCKFSTNFRGCPLVRNEEKTLYFAEFAVILLRCPELIGNPHMKANIVEVLFMGSLPLADGSPGFITHIFSSDKLVMHNILYALLNFYVMVEKTGASSQFYDKFNTRYYISIILEELWKIPTYRQQLENYSKNNVDFFVRFIARMLNDTTYLLDETFNELNLIHNYQQELKRRSIAQGEDTETYGTLEELNNNLSSAERKAKSYVGLSNKTMELFKLFSKQTPEGFELPEIVDRLAGMLNYNLSVMVGPKCSNLKVQDPTKYEFDPKRTLSDLCEVYCNLSGQKKFLIAVARDGRSFKIEYFKKAKTILETKTNESPKNILTFIKFAEKAEQQRQDDASEEMEMGEVPDEFLDPLMYVLMEDPVILPSSKISIDRSTIKAHLLSDPTDPFNRMPLKLEDVKDDVELKQKIENFKKEKRKQFASTEMNDS